MRANEKKGAATMARKHGAGLAPSMAPDVLEAWLHGKSEHTARAYRSDLAEFFKLVPKLVGDVTISDCVEYQRALAREGGAVTTRNRKAATVRSFFAFLFQWGAIDRNPALILKTEKGPEPPPHVLTEEQVIRLVTGTPARMGDLIRWLYVTGCRVSELVGLKWEDIEEDDKTGNARVRIFGKGGKTRVIVIKGDALKGPKRWNKERSGIVWPRRGTAEPLSAEYIRREVAKWSQKILGQKISPHWLRHSHISHALDRLAPIHLVQECAGHSSLETTSVYTHARPTDGSSLYLIL